MHSRFCTPAEQIWCLQSSVLIKLYGLLESEPSVYFWPSSIIFPLKVRFMPEREDTLKLQSWPSPPLSLTHSRRNLSAHWFHLLSFKRFLGNVVWEREKKEPWHFFGTPLCPSCPERGGYHGISGHLIKQTIVGACVSVCVCMCMCMCVCVCVCATLSCMATTSGHHQH